ncbi:putative DNA binding protein [Corchorus olitorius]|uniref:DNA binding protein n=1 Tax=Corchorus olitorius TaxID=93759 RepID=A0A1R3HMN3_9ROSI|nr:putative DNA binding protein [Corchorus olitorius]
MVIAKLKEMCQHMFLEAWMLSGTVKVEEVAEDMLVLHLLLLLPVAEHCNPVLGYGVSKNANYQFQRRPESKSGSIVPPGSAVYSTGSPLMQLLDDGGSGSVRN